MTLIKICSFFEANGQKRLRDHNSDENFDKKKKGSSQAEHLKSDDAPAEAADAPEFVNEPDFVREPEFMDVPEVKTDPEETAFDKWDEVLQNLKKSGKMVLYANLLKAKAVILSEGQVGVVSGRKTA